MKKIICVIIVIAVAALVIYLCNTDSSILNKNTISTNTNTQTENKINNNKTNEQNKNEVENNIENSIENNIVNEINENEIKNEISSETFNEEPKTEQEKAKEIVKNDWKDISNCEISIDAINGNGEYIVTIRDTKTTQALAYYMVNVIDNTFTKKVMD